VAGRARKPEVVKAIRDSFLDAAALAFAQRGFAGASMREVAQAAGYTAPALYQYFKNKQALYQALVDRLNAETAELIAGLPPARGLTLEQRVQHWTRALFEFVAERAAVFQVLGSIAAGAGSPPSRSGALRQSRLLEERDETLGTWLAGGRKSSHVGLLTTSEAAAFFRLLALHFWLQWCAEKPASARAADPFTERAPLAARLFLYGVSAQPALLKHAPSARRRTSHRRFDR
jgi:AcrR family transcriptional regulator